MQSGISNGVKQSGCSSLTLFSVYLNKLIEIQILDIDMTIITWVYIVMPMVLLYCLLHIQDCKKC